MHNNEPSAVVVGAGFGGLAAAIRLRLLGFRVTLIEALDQPGGRARVFRRDGYTFDAGPTVITAPYLLDELFEAAGRDPGDYFRLAPVDPFYRILFNDGNRFDYVGDEERILSQVAALEPRDVEGYRRLAAHAERIFEVGYTQLADRPFHRAADMLRVLPQMVRLESHRTVHGLVSKYIRDERLRQAFTFEPLLVGGNPFTTTSIYLLIHWLERKWGVHFALGGTGSIVAGMTRLLEELGVDVRLNTPVEEIEIGTGRVAGVRISGGALVPADVVVCNADPSMVYSRMIPEDYRGGAGASPQRMRESMSLFVAYFGADRSARDGDLAHHTVIMGPRYRELLGDIFERKTLARDHSLYLHAPTRTDPSMAPAGKEAFYVLSPVPNLRSGVDWSRAAAPYFERILDTLDARALPGIRGRLHSVSFMTPQDFQDTLRSRDGAAFGPEPVLTQSAWFRYHNRSPTVGGLYFVGAGTHPGGGVPGVLNSAKVMERVIRAEWPGLRPLRVSPRERRDALAAR
jgi:phytoene desaturase